MITLMYMIPQFHFLKLLNIFFFWKLFRVYCDIWNQLNSPPPDNSSIFLTPFVEKPCFSPMI